MASEVQDWTKEKQLLLHTQLKIRIQQVQRWKKVAPGEAVERMWDEMLAANRRFDERFNAAFFQDTGRSHRSRKGDATQRHV